MCKQYVYVSTVKSVAEVKQSYVVSQEKQFFGVLTQQVALPVCIQLT